MRECLFGSLLAQRMPDHSKATVSVGKRLGQRSERRGKWRKAQQRLHLYKKIIRKRKNFLWFFPSFLKNTNWIVFLLTNEIWYCLWKWREDGDSVFALVSSPLIPHLQLQLSRSPSRLHPHGVSKVSQHDDKVKLFLLLLFLFHFIYIF